LKKIIFNLIAAVTVPGTYKLDGKDLNNQFDNQEIPFYAE